VAIAPAVADDQESAANLEERVLTTLDDCFGGCESFDADRERHANGRRVVF
jgi:hypothetical protein